jgi:hypothetical protein
MNSILPYMVVLVAQVPFLIAFIWCVLRLTDSFSRDLKDRDTQYLLFLSTERDHRQSIADLTTDLTESVKNLVAEMMTHGVTKTEHTDNLESFFAQHQEWLKNNLPQLLNQ